LLAPLYGSDWNVQPSGTFTSRLSTDRSPSTVSPLRPGGSPWRVATNELQDGLSKTLGEDERSTSAIRARPRDGTCALDPEVVAILSAAYHAVFAELGLSDGDEAVALRVARRIIELAARGERDPERLKAVVLAWVTK
jgi:hypothetical protein